MNRSAGQAALIAQRVAEIVASWPEITDMQRESAVRILARPAPSRQTSRQPASRAA